MRLPVLVALFALPACRRVDPPAAGPEASEFTLTVSTNPDLVLEEQISVQGPPAEAWLRCEGGDEERYALSSARAELHSLALRGLLAESRYDCALAMMDGAETLFQSSFVVETESLPEGLPSLERVVWDGEPRGYTLLNHARGRGDGDSAKLLIVDDQGRVRWYLGVAGEPTELDAMRTPDGDVLFGGGGTVPPTVVDLSGQTLLTVPASSTGGGYHHHAEWLPGAQILALAEADDSLDEGAWKGFVLELRDAAAGDLLWSWRSQRGVEQGALQPSPDFADPYHANWAALDEDFAWVNLRNSDQLLKISRATSEVTWSLGVDGDFALLGEEGEAAEVTDWFYGAHGPDLRGDRVLLYDNGWSRPGGASSRVVELALDETAMTAQITWTWQGSGWYEPVWGDADYLGEDRVIVTRAHCEDCESASALPSAILEVDRDSHTVLWELDFASPKDATYRSERLDDCQLFGDLNACQR